eukprot:TRINITY_DN2161_c1_g1_i1.p1 TRINITY_DN2161_c1_g1~~TRINITY_DN2161_c1_g1_i1.p1  ORF type:complete len:685 (+),score=153.72 TRINITY_DN2161_c1_g1_i1:843-2897(+)
MTVDKMCDSGVSDGSYATRSECVKNVAKEGKTMLDLFHTISFEGATGHVQLLETYNERRMPQVIEEFREGDFSPIGMWYPESDVEAGAETLQFSSDPVYASNDGIPPMTVFVQEVNEDVKVISYFVCIVAVLVSILFIIAVLKHKKNSGQTFFNTQMQILVLCILPIHLIFRICNGLLTLSPSENQVKVSIFFEYTVSVPMLLLLSVMSSRLYRFFKVTSNKKLRQVTFSNHHQLWCFVGMVALCMSFIVVRMVFDNGSDTEGSVWSKLFELQDEDLSKYFTLTKPVFNIYIDTACSISAFSLKLICLLVMFSFMATIAYLCGSVKKSSITKDMKVMQMLCSLLVGLGAIEVAVDAAILSNGKSTTHVGFENADSNVTLSQMKSIIYIEMVSAFIVWLCFIVSLLKTGLGRQFKRTFFFGKSSSMAASSSQASTTNSQSTGAGTLDKHRIPEAFISRMKVLSSNGTPFTTVRSSSITAGTGTAQSIGRISIDGFRQTIPKGSQAGSQAFANNSRSVSGAVDTKYEVAMLSASTTGFSIDNATVTSGGNGSVAKYETRGAHREKLDSKIFIQDFTQLSPAEREKVLFKLESTLRAQFDQTARLINQLKELDNKLNIALHEMEVFQVRASRIHKVKGRRKRIVSQIISETSNKHGIRHTAGRTTTDSTVSKTGNPTASGHVTVSVK